MDTEDTQALITRYLVAIKLGKMDSKLGTPRPLSAFILIAE